MYSVVTNDIASIIFKLYGITSILKTEFRGEAIEEMLRKIVGTEGATYVLPHE